MKTILSLFILCLLIAPSTMANSKDYVAESNVKLLVEGVRSLDRVGLYRVRDPEEGYLIYILRDQRTDGNPELYVVPMNDNKSQQNTAGFKR